MNFFWWISTVFSSWYAMVWHDIFLQYYQNIEIFCNSPRKFKSHCYYLWNNLHWGYGWSETLYILSTMLSCFSCVWLLGTPWTAARQITLSWNFPGKNTGVGYHFLLQGIFLAQGSNMRLFQFVHGQMDSLPLLPPGKPLCSLTRVS